MTTINYDQPVKDLIAEHNKSGHVTHKSYKKKSVTLHHNGGRLSHEGILNVWKTRPASAHFDCDKNGKVAQYVKVNEYAWAAGNTQGNIESIHIEMANETLAPEWRVAEATWKSAARLAGWLFAKVIKARPSNSNFFVHNHWKATICAGPHIKKVWPKIMAEAQRAYDEFTKAPVKSRPKPTPQQPKPTPPSLPPTPQQTKRKALTQIAAEVWAGDWGSGSDRIKRLRAAGYDPEKVQALVNAGVGRRVNTARKSVGVIASEVIAGKWGNGDDRTRKLRAAGYDPKAVQAEVNRRLR